MENSCTEMAVKNSLDANWTLWHPLLTAYEMCEGMQSAQLHTLNPTIFACCQDPGDPVSVAACSHNTHPEIINVQFSRSELLFKHYGWCTGECKCEVFGNTWLCLTGVFMMFVWCWLLQRCQFWWLHLSPCSLRYRWVRQRHHMWKPRLLREHGRLLPLPLWPRLHQPAGRHQQMRWSVTLPKKKNVYSHHNCMCTHHYSSR